MVCIDSDRRKIKIRKKLFWKWKFIKFTELFFRSLELFNTNLRSFILEQFQINCSFIFSRWLCIERDFIMFHCLKKIRLYLFSHLSISAHLSSCTLVLFPMLVLVHANISSSWSYRNKCLNDVHDIKCTRSEWPAHPNNLLLIFIGIFFLHVFFVAQYVVNVKDKRVKY